MSRDSDRGRQLTFDLARAPSFASEDFLVAPSNAGAHAMIELWPAWPSRAMLLLGPPGSGKSHLSAMWAARSGACILSTVTEAWDLGGRPVSALMEDADRAGHEEAGFFHLMNGVVETGGWLLVTARTPPDRWGLRTPDLLSRLRLAARAELGPPDASLLKAVIVKLFADRQILISEDVVAYAALHCEQSLDAVAAFVAAVDEDALVSGRRITRPLAAKTLSRLRLAPSGESDHGPT